MYEINLLIQYGPRLQIVLKELELHRRFAGRTWQMPNLSTDSAVHNQ